GEVFEAEPAVERLLEPPGHSRELMPAIDRVMREAGLGYSDLEALAVGTGPGGFTGLRIGIATAHGIAHARGIPIHPVLSIDALGAGIEGGEPFPLIDAKRNEVYGPGPFVASPAQAAARAPDNALAAGDGSI